MSNGSILELISKGKLDEDLTNNSSLFNYDIIKKKKYSKGDTIFYSTGKTDWGNTVRFKIERMGDLLYGLYVRIKLPKLSIENLNVIPQQQEYDSTSIYRLKYADFIGNVIVEKASFYINGLVIDELYGEYMQVYTDLYLSDWNRKSMIGMDDNLNKPNLKIESEFIYVPLKFHFCNDINKPLPLIALQNSEIFVDIKFRDFDECVCILEEYDTKFYHSNKIHSKVSLEEVNLLATFYFLELDERKELAMKDYEILITQSQYKSIVFNSQINIDIEFNHVIKDLIFFIQPAKNKYNGEYFNFSAKTEYLPNELIQLTQNKLWTLEPKRHLLSKARLLFNGIERIEWRDAKYFYSMQNHENYKNPLQTYVYMYSFNSNPTKDTNFSGCNFSRLDKVQLQVIINQNPFIVDINPERKYPLETNFELKCFATNYNFLVIKNGIGGLKYST